MTTKRASSLLEISGLGKRLVSSARWFHAVDGCANDTPLAQVIFPLMRNCFFGGAIHAVLLLQKGYGDRLAADIASFMMEEPRSTAKALTYVPRARSRNDGSEEICQSIRAADSDAGSDKPERDADAEAELLHDRFATLIANCATS